MQMLHGGCDTSFLVAGWDDDRQKSEWRGRRRRQVVVSSVQFAVGMLNVERGREGRGGRAEALNLSGAKLRDERREKELLTEGN